MKKKILFLLGFSLIITACSSTKTYEAGKYEDPYQILESKREQYRRQDEEKQKEAERKAEEERRALEEAKEKIETVEVETVEGAEAISSRENIEQEKLKIEEEMRLKKEEAERIKKLPYEERMQYKANKAMDKINEMVNMAGQARAEELRNKDAIDEIEEMLNPQVMEENAEIKE